MCNFTPDETPQLRGPVPLSHLLIRQFVRCGDYVIDATCGNGHDTSLLAGLVGRSGRVWAFDIQQKAVEATSFRLADSANSFSAIIVHTGHEHIAEHCNGPVKAVVFNLGYMPGGDRSIITRPDSTLAGFEQSVKIIEPGGVVIITLYPGHKGGELERNVLETRLAQLSPVKFHVWRMGQFNVTDSAPYVILVQKAI